MKATNVVQRVDDLGRVVLQVKLRRERELESNSEVEMSVGGNYILSRSYVSGCVACGDRNEFMDFMAKPVCRASAGTQLASTPAS